MKPDKYLGKKYNHWTILERIPQTRPAKYICSCDCGNIKEIWIGNLTRGLSKNCMDCQKKRKSIHLIGSRVGKLTLIDLPIIDGHVRHKVQCECGEIKLIRQNPNSTYYSSCGKCKANQKVGKKFGKLIVIKYLNDSVFECLCECGNKCHKSTEYLRKSKFHSCGCLLTEKNIINAKRLEKYKYHRLTIMKFIRMGEDRRAIYSVKCKCGNKFEKSISYIFDSKSCGCLHKESVPKGSKNAFSKNNEVDVGAMRELFDSGLYTKKELSIMFNVSLSCICDIINVKTWKHVK